MSDRFPNDVSYLLATHREGEPLVDCPPCRGTHWGQYREHLVRLIVAARAEADKQRRRSTAEFTRILAEHAPYTRAGGSVQCNACLTLDGGGEFPTTLEWARHVDLELSRSGLRVAPTQVPR